MISWLWNLWQSIPIDGMAIAVLAFVYDLLRRYIPSKNPGGFIYDVAVLFRAVSGIFLKLAILADKMIGQNSENGPPKVVVQQQVSGQNVSGASG